MLLVYSCLALHVLKFDRINFYQNRPKIKLFLPKKYKIFERWGLVPPPDPHNSTPLQNSDYEPGRSIGSLVEE